MRNTNGSLHASAVATSVRQFIADSFNYRGDTESLGESVSLLESGLIDSMGVLELVTFLESEFPITIADDEMLPTNLDTIGAIVAFIQRKTALNKVA